MSSIQRCNYRETKECKNLFPIFRHHKSVVNLARVIKMLKGVGRPSNLLLLLFFIFLILPWSLFLFLQHLLPLSLQLIPYLLFFIYILILLTPFLYQPAPLVSMRPFPQASCLFSHFSSNAYPPTTLFCFSFSPSLRYSFPPSPHSPTHSLPTTPDPPLCRLPLTSSFLYLFC